MTTQSRTISPQAQLQGAIRGAARMLRSSSAFHIWFELVTIATTPTINMRHDAETLANKLKLLHGQFLG